MRINNAVVSTFLFLAEISTISYTSAFTLNNNNVNRPLPSCTQSRSSSSSSSSSVGTFLSATSEQQPCDVPSDIEGVVLSNSKSIRNAIVTNVDGEQINLGDMMGIEKDDMTSVVVFLRHMG